MQVSYKHFGEGVVEWFPPAVDGALIGGDAENAVELLGLLREHSLANPDCPWVECSMEKDDPDAPAVVDLFLTGYVRIACFPEPGGKTTFIVRMK